jgi:hypothetical protein
VVGVCVVNELLEPFGGNGAEPVVHILGCLKRRLSAVDECIEWGLPADVFIVVPVFVEFRFEHGRGWGF